MSEIPLNKDSFVSSIALSALAAFGQASLTWEPEILRDIFENEMKMTKMPQKMFDKLNCGYMLIGTDAFSSTIEGFLSATAIMNNLVFDSSEIPYCELKHCAWSVYEYMNLLGDTENGKPTDVFCPEIITYIKEVGKSNGIYRFPACLSFADSEQPLPADLTGDVTLFEMYHARQDDYIAEINNYVNNRKEMLEKELLQLAKLGFVA